MLFVFDMDQVLFEYDWQRRMSVMTELTGLSLTELRDRWWNAAGEGAAEAGAYPSADSYLAALCDALGTSVSERDFLRARGGAMTAWPVSLQAVARAASYGTVTLLTNNGPLVGENLATLAPELVPLFGEAHLFASSDYGARKPDPVVFERVLERYGAEPSETFFADDLPENVAGAASVGIAAHLFRTPAALLAAVDAFAHAPAHAPAPAPAPARAPAIESGVAGSNRAISTD
ncbi:HAD-IA family hydrolase [Leifsonia sp. NPDC058248]|uniref:HAD-IA family hydrolase n=1 Tax=Leifsonia sp. NPDC058248 TaxID=3346402 RepID=UPI0036D7D89C